MPYLNEKTSNEVTKTLVWCVL